MTNAERLAKSFTDFACERLRDACTQIERCVRLLSPEQIWHRPNEVSNAIGNLVLHLNGNVRQWIVSGIGGEPFQRDRPAEFSRRDPLPAEELLAELHATVADSRQIIARLSAEQLCAELEIQGYAVTGTAAVLHVVEHFSLHTGQIVYAAKLLLNRDLSLYDANGRRIDGRRDGTP